MKFSPNLHDFVRVAAVYMVTNWSLLRFVVLSWSRVIVKMKDFLKLYVRVNFGRILLEERSS